MKKTYSFALLLTAMTAAAQTSEFYYLYDDEAKTATVTYKHGNISDGGSYSGDVVIPAKAPNGYDVKYIGEHAFINSSGITSLTIPATIDSIGSEPFYDSKAHMAKITVEDGDRPLKCFVRDAWPSGCYPVFGRDVNVDEVYVGRILDSRVSRGWVEAVYDGAWSALRDSKYIKTVTMGSALQEVPRDMFHNCKALRTVNFSPNTKSIGYAAFQDCDTLSSIRIPEGVEWIDTLAFSGCDSLLQVTLPSTLKLIHTEAFTSCPQIAAISIPASVDSIGAHVFDGCKALRHFTVENGNTPLRLWSNHYWGGWQTILGALENLETVKMGRPMISDMSALYYCTKLHTVEYTYPAEEVADQQFYHCTGLRSVTFCGNPRRIGKEAFLNCEALQTITLPDGVELIDEDAFKSCTALEHIGLPAQLKTIGGYAFLYCHALTQFTIPASVDSIGNGILNDCNNLKRIDIAYSPRPLKYYCPNQFNNSLRAAPIDTLYTDRYIDGYFSNNLTLKKLYVGPNVTSIINEIFSYCSNIDEVYSLNPVPPTCEGSNVFHSDTKEKGQLHVPAGSLDAYKEAFVWQDFFNIDEIPDTKCRKPTLTLDGGKLKFECETQGVEFHYTITYPDKTSGTGSEAELVQTVIVSLYATKEGLEDSDVAYYELLIASGGSNAKKGDVNEDGTVDVADISAVISIMAAGSRETEIED